MSEKADPEALALRAKPRKIVRVRRNLLIAGAGLSALLILGATGFALRGHRTVAPERELFATARNRLPDVMAELPSRYDHIKLGAPLPGDLGGPVIDRERALGLAPAETSFKPNPVDDAARAERIRLAQQARQANESGVFFTLANQSGGVGPTAVVSPPIIDAPEAPLALDAANAQGHKLAVLNAPLDKSVYNSHVIEQPRSPYELLAGTIITASLISGINSDIPGTVMAQVTSDLRDSVSGSIVLVPRGSRLIGTFDSVVAFGQSRALVVWQRIVMPNGTSIEIDNQPASDSAGYSGLEDDVDYHTWSLLKGIALSTLLGVGTQVTFGNSNSDLVEAIRQSTQESTSQAGQRIVEKDLDVQPTITIRPGWPVTVLLSKDIVLQPYVD